MKEGLKNYIEALPKLEADYARQLLGTLEDRIDFEYPEREDYSISFHRSVEIEGVVQHYIDLQRADDREERRTVSILKN